MAHARRKFFNLHVANKSQLAEQALHSIGVLFQVAGQGYERRRPMAIMGFIQSARMNRLDPYAYLKDVLTALPAQRASEFDQLLPHQWAHGSLRAVSRTDAWPDIA